MENVPYFVSPLSVSEKSDKFRLILDLRHNDKTKFEDWDDMLNYVENECLMYKLDIKQGYYHIDIKPEHQKYLGFALPFGLTLAPFIFTKTTRVPV